MYGWYGSMYICVSCVGVLSDNSMTLLEVRLIGQTAEVQAVEQGRECGDQHPERHVLVGAGQGADLFYARLRHRVCVSANVRTVHRHKLHNTSLYWCHQGTIHCVSDSCVCCDNADGWRKL